MNLSREKIRNLAHCPKCGAKPGELCEGKGKKNHHERLCAAQKIASKSGRPSPKPRAKNDGFYATWEWKQLRYEALKMHGHRCQCCGWTPGDTKSGRLVVDHIKPRKEFPELALTLSNLQVLCNDCNMGKSNVYSDDYRTFDAIHFATIQ